QQYHLHLGSTVVVPFYALRQAHEVFSSNSTPPAHGTIERFTVVGVAASAVDYPSSTPNYSVYVGRAFADSVGRRSVAGTIAFVRLAHGAADVPRFAFQVNHLSVTGGFAGVQGNDDLTAAIEGSIHPQAIGWWLFALLAGLAGIALVGQALSRQSTIARETYPPLAAVGVRPIQLVGIGMARAVVVGVTGAIGALALATALSPLTPVGEARVAEPQAGVVVDPVVFGLGGLAIVAVVLLLGAVPAWRAGQVRRFQLREERAVGGGASRIAAAVSRAGAGPSVLVGVRHALERGRGRTSVPVATALVGTSAAVAALVATSVFGASLSTLLSTPRLYGQDFQVVIGSLTGPQVRGVVAHLQHDPGAERVSYAQLGKYVTINGVSVQATLAVAAKGPLVFSLIQGRDPQGEGELALGTQTLRAVGAHVGSTVSTVVIGPSGRSTTTPFRVVGTMAFPPSVGSGGLGTGAVVTLGGALDAVCPSGPRATACRSSVLKNLYSPHNNSWGLAVKVAPDAAGRATASALLTRFAQQATPLSVPTNLVNFGEAVNFPALLGATLAIFGAATLVHLLLASASRRRREFALLKVLGFVRRQVRATVGWQATTVAVIGIVVGVPLGVALGGIVWQAFASNLGAVPLTVVSAGTVALIALGVLVVGNLLAVLPASLAARNRPAAPLREE
ncbi:MAG TPA: FtsX-like permease family protein, partial [Acidimicrobiales bacterium]|nr:FtsX-like permease family protein [Acidimicrobiales bacterium]